MNLIEIGEKYYSEYSLFIGIMRGSVDLSGLKRVHLRLLYALSTLKNRDEIKTASLVGETIGKYHPHGDQSLVEAIETLVKMKLLKGFGNWGNFNRGLEYMKPAAMRYTSVGWTKLLDYVFEFINEVEFIDAQIDSNKEPLMIPTPLPLCLLNFGNRYTLSSLFSGLSPGLKTVYPQFYYKDLIDFIINMIQVDFNLDQIKKELTFPEVFLGDNVDINYLNQTKESIWLNTSFKLQIQPRIKTNPKNREVIIYAITSKKLFTDQYLDSISKYIDKFVDKSTPFSTEVYIKFSRSKYYENFLNDIQKNMKVNLNFNIAINDFDKIYTEINLLKWVMYTVMQYREFAKKYLSRKVAEYDTKIKEIKLIEQLRPYIRESLKQNNSTQEFLNFIKDKFDVNKVKEIITKHNIKKLLDTNLELKSLETKRDQYQFDLDNINEYIIKKYNEIKEIEYTD